MTKVDLQLPPGFRFHPTDEELVIHYLCRKCASQQIVVPIIAEIDLYKFNPWNLPDLALYGEKEWYFFTPRDRKYPNGSRPNRSAGTGYWKATGADKPIGNPKPVGIKKALVFYNGKAPKGEKSNWIMHEYRLADVDRSADRKKNNSLRLDDWVLCRIYNKKGSTEKNQVMRSNTNMSSIEEDKKPDILPPRPSSSMHLLRLGQPDSVPKLHSDSSCSGALVVSPEFTCEREVQSEQKPTDWEKTTIDFPFQYLDTGSGVPTTDQFQSSYQISPLQDVFMYLQKPF